ncbi:MAG TPA: GTP-binding protein [Chthoniobacterales bacterium]|nr:GTP-binding protein [Chthoniobacterales bacterium]
MSIAAGPSTPALLDLIGADPKGRQIGLLSSSTPHRSSGLTTFYLPPGSDPERIVSEIRLIAGKRTVDQLIIECEPDRAPMAYASLFVASNHLPQTLGDVSQLTASVFAIQPRTLLDTILGRGTNLLPPCFVAEQLEFGSRIFLQGICGDEDFELARTIASALNPRAQILPLNPDALENRRDFRGISFDFEAALNSAGWRQLLDSEQPAHIPDKRVTAFGYHGRRPFHPERFWNLLERGWRGVFRAKGFFWLATRMDEVGGVNLAGSELHCASAGAWWAARDQSTRESEMPERTRAEWQEPFGDRRQSFGVMALDVDRTTLRSSLDGCLLTDKEMTAGRDTWAKFPDPFPSWSSNPHAHHHDHERNHHHDSEEHDCCHH